MSGLHQVGLVAAGITLIAAARRLCSSCPPGPATRRARWPSSCPNPSPIRWGSADVPSATRTSTAAAGRPRDPACDAAILQATLDVFAEEGYAGVSIDGVAARAGVGKATIYRRYSSKAELVVEAVRCGRTSMTGSPTPATCAPTSRA